MTSQLITKAINKRRARPESGKERRRDVICVSISLVDVDIVLLHKIMVTSSTSLAEEKYAFAPFIITNVKSNRT